MADTSPPVVGPSAALIGALRQVLRPLVRLLIARGIAFPYLAELLKSVYVEVAVNDFTLPDKPQTDSRLSLLTGLHRKDVKRLREEGQAAGHGKNAPLSAQLIGRWLGDARYLAPDGTPRALPRLAAHGDPSFEGLVASTNKDIRPRAILDEWLRQSIAKLDVDDRVHLMTNAFVPSAGEDDKSYYFGRNLHDHMATGVDNLLGERPPLLERNVYYDQLTPESVTALASLARDHGMRALQALNAAALDHQEQDAGNPAAGCRMSFGVYFYTPPTSAGTDGTHEL